jgi:sulfite exporter TauE/SafE
MPCGLVYAALGVALGTGSATGGALAMAAFFFGTLPSMLAVGMVARRVSELAQKASRAASERRAWIRRAAGVAIVVFGLVDVTSAVALARASSSGSGSGGSGDRSAEAAHACCPHHHASEMH